MESIDVEGATGNVHTNYAGKAAAAVDAFRRGKQFVFIHVEGPDECGHRAELDNKILSIERIDAEIVKTVCDYLASTGDDYKVMILPDHPTPICKRTHTIDPVPFMIFDSRKTVHSSDIFDEEAARATGLYLPRGHELLDVMIGEREV